MRERECCIVPIPASIQEQTTASSPYSLKDNLLVSAGRRRGAEFDGKESGTQNEKDGKKDKNEDDDEDLDGKRKDHFIESPVLKIVVYNVV